MSAEWYEIKSGEVGLLGMVGEGAELKWIEAEVELFRGMGMGG